MHGLHVSPDLDSVTYWLGDVFDRERGWGRRDETFRATEELRAFDPEQAWFGLGDLDLATHLFRTNLLAAGETLSAATAAVARRFGVVPRLLPMSDDPVTTRISVVADGEELDLHFQEYWVAARGTRRGQGRPVRGGRTLPTRARGPRGACVRATRSCCARRTRSSRSVRSSRCRGSATPSRRGARTSSA